MAVFLEIELLEGSVNRARPQSRKTYWRAEGAAADEQPPRRGRPRIADDRVTRGHERHRDRGRGGCPCQALGSDTAASPAIKMRRSPTSSCASLASVAVRRLGRLRGIRLLRLGRLRGIRPFRLGRGLRWLLRSNTTRSALSSQRALA